MRLFKNPLYAFGVGLLALQACARGSSSQANESTQFYTEQTLPNNATPGRLHQAALAAYRLPGCSAFAVSSDGYIVTALHCVLDACFNQSKTENILPFTDISVSFPVGRPGTASIPGDGRCLSPFVTLASQEQQFASDDPPVLVSYGGSYNDFDDHEFLNSNFTSSIAKQISENFHDWVVLKYNVSKPLNCVKIAHIKPKVNDRVWSLAYHSRSYFDNQLSISYGNISDSVKDNEFFKELNFTNREYDLAQTAYLSSGNTFLSSLDVVPGNSGSMVIDQDGEVVGLNIQIANEAPDQGTRYIPYVAITQDIEEVVNNTPNASKIFNCEN